ncbi:reverse transcriptase domain-containing protein [Tanacetum coccineum]
MITPVEKRNANKFCEFHGEVGHKTDECNHLRKQIEDMLKAGKLSHIIRELKQSSGKEQPKKKGETSEKEKPQAILMIQSRQKAIRQKITQSFSPNPEMLFPHLRDDEGAEGPLIIEAEIGGHQVHRMCVDGGSSFEILYENYFNRLRPEIKNQMVPTTTSLIGFSNEIKWPLGQITLLVKIGDDEHSTSAWMDFMVVRSTSPHNGIIGRPGLRKIQAVPSTVHGMIKFPVIRGILTLKGSKIIPVECAMVFRPEEQPILVNKVKEERVKVEINPEHPEQTVMIGSDLTEKTRSKRKEAKPQKGNVAINDAVSKPCDSGITREVLIRLALQHREWVNGTPGAKPIRARGQYISTDKLRKREAAFRQMKEHIAKLPMLTAPEEQEELIVYLAASKEAVSAVLMTEKKPGRCHLILSASAKGHGRSQEFLLLDKCLRFYIEDTEEVVRTIPAKEEGRTATVGGPCFMVVSSCVDGCGAEVILTDPGGVELTTL